MDNKPEQKSSKPVQKVSKPTAKWKRFFGKKWVFPGIYMLAAALILALMWWMQGSRIEMNPNQQGTGSQLQQTTDDRKSVPANAKEEKMASPAANDTHVTMKFYDEGASAKEKEAALVQYDNSFSPHTGVDFAHKEDKSFAVSAALSGTVKSVSSHPLNGQEVRLEHAGGLETVYQSLAEVKVKAGDKVAQGDQLGMAGSNKVEKDAGLHLHFEVWKDGNPVNPETYLTSKGQ
ncbi:M23 family metallopeptidase [Numidum massiliense]|uniref:M23 family metallopeptidase n=1 Tax=Numidum massiliense TaxID=1522315 RepID=UPI0006D55552|nr:M23 family metallopeptidase [Numidum massiliense]